jgi:cell division transport system permease protein
VSKQPKYKKRTSFLPSVLSITLVLCFAGLLGFVFIQAKAMGDYFRENFELRVYLQEGTEEHEGVQLSMQLRELSEVKAAEFISKNEAAQKEMIEQGIDFIESLGYNPLPHSLNLRLHSEYTSEENIRLFVAKIKKNKIVESVAYPEDLLQMVNQNVSKIQLILLIIVGLFLIATIIVINSTIRLNIFARRFLIKSMQYVGATDAFIIIPFLKMYLWQGLLGALLAITATAILLHQLYINFPGFIDLQNPYPYLAIWGALILLSVLITIPSTYFACRKYLRTDINKLY